MWNRVDIWGTGLIYVERSIYGEQICLMWNKFDICAAGFIYVDLS